MGKSAPCAADRVDVIASYGDLVLHVRATFHSDISQRVHHADHLLTEKIADLHPLAVVSDGNVDRKVGVHKAHLVFEALQHNVGG